MKNYLKAKEAILNSLGDRRITSPVSILNLFAMRMKN